MTKKLSTLLNIFVIISLAVPWTSITPAQPALAASAPQESHASTGIFRTRVTLTDPTSWARLDELGVTVLDEGDDWAVLLAAGDQLEPLARLGFQPRGSDDLGALITAHAGTSQWLAEGMSSQLKQAAALWAQVETARMNAPNAEADSLPAEAQIALSDLHGILQAFSPEQTAAIDNLISPDSDGDGLTDTEELWWCTDPLNANSDGDAQGYTDYEEITAILDFTLARNVRWGYGPPFGPPNLWPDWNGADGDPATPACNDGDWDTIPDYAEVYVVGTRVPAESTDNDKFDDGQELFGITYCPGAPTNCGYGSYPALEYWWCWLMI